MQLEIPFPHKAFPTPPTLVPSLRLVHCPMRFEIVPSFEALSAHSALVWSVTPMGVHVSFCHRMFEPFPTHAALVGLLRRMHRPRVAVEATPRMETLWALPAVEPRLVVKDPVLLEKASGGEDLAAGLALGRPSKLVVRCSNERIDARSWHCQCSVYASGEINVVF